MVKVEVIENFTLKAFNEIENSIIRFDKNKNKKGHLYEKDTFECTEEMVDYLMGGNDQKKVVVKILEVTPTQPKETIEKVVESVKDGEEIITPIEEKPKKSKKKKAKK